MIGKAKSISHGINALRYITGESRNKKHPELIYHIKDNLLPCRLDAQGVWDMIKAHAPTGKNMIRIEISPAKEHTEHFTLKDWERLWDDFVREFDSMEFKGRHGNVYSHRTNLAGSIYSVNLHLESKSGIPHLHAAVCRKDKDGRTNNDHNIHLRAQYAAERIARKRGWTTAAEIRRTNADEVTRVLTGILRSMPSWSWNDYVARVRKKGYTLEERRDKKDVLQGYTVGIGDIIYKASELGKGRTLMASKIETTWNRLHNRSVTELKQEENKVPAQTATRSDADLKTTGDRPVADYSSWQKAISKVPEPVYAAYIPKTKSGFETSVTLRELWLLKPEKIYTPYSTDTLRDVKAIYLPANQGRTESGQNNALKVIKDNKLNAVVIDMKDDYGLLRYDTKDPLVLEKGYISQYAVDLDQFVKKFKDENIYLIARIVVFKDKNLSQYGGGKYAVWNRVTGGPWVGTRGTEDVVDEEGNVTGTQTVYYDENWVDPYSEEVWEYNIAIAKELISRGFDEIQFDYIRFCTERGVGDVVYEGFLQSYDQKLGMRSYGACVDLLVEKYLPLAG